MTEVCSEVKTAKRKNCGKMTWSAATKIETARDWFLLTQLR